MGTDGKCTNNKPITDDKNDDNNKSIMIFEMLTMFLMLLF